MFADQNEYVYLDTYDINDKVSKCESIEDLKENVFPKIREQKDAWAYKMDDILKKTGYTEEKFSKLCGVSRVSVSHWRHGAIPKNRETFIKIGLVAGYSREEMDQLLQRYGRYPGLYSKSLEDLVCIYVIEQNYGEKAIENYQSILNEIREKIIGDNSSDGEQDVVTEKFDAELSKVENNTELENFVQNNIAVFSRTFHKLYSYVEINIQQVVESDIGLRSIYGKAAQEGWSSSLKQCISAISGKKWYPTRNKIISIGLHLSMDHEQIDEMLVLAHMEPLCGKNIFESVIMYVLDDASLSNAIHRNPFEGDVTKLCSIARNVLTDLSLEVPEITDFSDFLSELLEVKNKDAGE